jgi:hypothetical protein
MRMLAKVCVFSMLAGAFHFTAPDSNLHAQSMTEHRHMIETYPIMAFVGIYSVQYSYRITEKNEIIVGLAYVNVDVNDRDGIAVGQLNAPTLPVGFRRYLWRNAHVEYQLWPAFNNYYDRIGGRYYPGFDLYNEVRAGYRLDFRIGRAPLFTNLQWVYGFGIYPGNKPENFHKAVEDAPPFHVPSVSIGMKF